MYFEGKALKYAKSALHTNGPWTHENGTCTGLYLKIHFVEDETNIFDYYKSFENTIRILLYAERFGYSIKKKQYLE